MSIDDLYSLKTNDAYYGNVRHDIISLFDKPVKNILEIGCGSGATLSYLKQLKLVEYAVGVDINDDMLNVALKNNVDKVYKHNFSNSHFCFDEKFFDVIMLLDVLEHMIDPWSSICDLVKFLSPGGVIISSIPNVQNFRVILPLLFGRWTYRDVGILDITHLRFFTKRSAYSMFRDAGLIATHVRSNIDNNIIMKIFNFLTIGIFVRYITTQFIFVAFKK